MTILILNGHGIRIHVDGAKLHIRDGHTSSTEEPNEYIFSPQRIDVDNIVINSRSGNISVDAIRWLVKHGVQITVLNWDGKILTTMLPPESVQVKTMFAQYRTFEDPKLRLIIAQKIIEAKFGRTQIVLDYLNQRYPDISTQLPQDSSNLKDAQTIQEVMGVESVVAGYYWEQIRKIIPKQIEFASRGGGRANRPMGASDTVNCMLNYGYALLEAECLRAINSVGLDVHVGFLHEMQQGKYSLAYDMQELFRFLIDLSVLNLVEKGSMEKKDFIRTENFTLKLRASGTRKITQEVNSWLNKTVNYQEKDVSWNYVIFLKIRELAHYLLGKKKSIDLISPEYLLARQDSNDVRKKILSIPYAQWKKQGFSKGTLHYMKKNAGNNKPFTLNKHVRRRLDQLGETTNVSPLNNSVG
jgi:CRISP-associated protein Cas1